MDQERQKDQAGDGACGPAAPAPEGTPSQELSPPAPASPLATTAPPGEDGVPQEATTPPEPPPSAEEQALMTQLRREAAEYDRLRERIQGDLERRKRQDLRGYALPEAVAKDLLPILDNLEEAGRAGTTQGFHQGMAIIVRQLQDFLGKLQVEEIYPSPGDHFDQLLMEATPAPANPTATVSAVLASGYRFKGAVLRRAKVQVLSLEAAAPEAVAKPTNGEPENLP